MIVVICFVLRFYATGSMNLDIIFYRQSFGFAFVRISLCYHGDRMIGFLDRDFQFNEPNVYSGKKKEMRRYMHTRHATHSQTRIEPRKREIKRAARTNTDTSTKHCNWFGAVYI